MPVSTRSGAVACGHPTTAAAAMQILEAGGNAFDAAIAAQFAACVAEPVLTSLAGGGFLLALVADDGDRPVVDRARLFDFFAHTPHRHTGSPDACFPIDADFGTTTQTFHIGPGSVATPGTVAGMFHIHRALASLPMTELVEPAVRAAREGLVVNDFQGHIFDIVRAIYDRAPGFTEARTGRRFRQAALADCMEQLAREGAGLFYRGEIGTRLIDFCQTEGGHLSREDLRAYQVLERRPLMFRHRGVDLLTNPLPSSGGVLIRHTLAALDREGVNPVDIAGALAATLESRASLLSDADQVNRGTTHISVVDGEGNAAAMTLSNGEGSGCLIPGTGIMTNNMLGEEDINPAGIGAWQPDQRLGSMMAPTLALGDDWQAALGSGGSNRIRSALVQVLVALLNEHLEPEHAIGRPRLHVESDLLSLEPGLDPAGFRDHPGLPRTIQQWDAPSLFFGGVHLVRHFKDGGLQAAGDPRRGGVGRILAPAIT